ncbi:MAG: Clp1/GlmU family protein, partial [Gammaproteobacteria bacterium]|nr:Clp1/GlmU family protein [Gammaproteobacteria bacterium]
MKRNAGPESAALSHNPDLIADALSGYRRVLLFGVPGAGKSTLSVALGAALAARGQTAFCLGSDPGSPAFGVPGAVCLGSWSDGGWELVDLEPLCSLDAGRFRLPLIEAVHRLLQRAASDLVLIDGPGVVRGVAGAELLQGLVRTAGVDHVLAVVRDGDPPPLAAELRRLEVPVSMVSAAAAARAPGRRARARTRTRRWDEYLQSARTHVFDLDGMTCLGAPPPLDAPAAWPGRQVAVLKGSVCVGFGEIDALTDDTIEARLVAESIEGDSLLIRDAVRGDDGMLQTAKTFGAGVVGFTPPPDALPAVSGKPDGPRPVARVGPVTASLVNGVFGDPLLHLRFRHQRRSLLFDLGEDGRLPARITHQVTDVFISHAHVDHIAGFLWLLRSRIGEPAVCRLYGPPGIAANIAGLIAGVHWDRIGSRGPRFEVVEFDGDRTLRCSMQAGQSAATNMQAGDAADGKLLREAGFLVRAAMLDHRTPVLAFSLEPELDLKVRKEQLLALDLEPGPWLTALKANIAAGQSGETVVLPDGTTRTAGELAEQLLLIRPGQKLVYATDLADT